MAFQGVPEKEGPRPALQRHPSTHLVDEKAAESLTVWPSLDSWRWRSLGVGIWTWVSPPIPHPSGTVGEQVVPGRPQATSQSFLSTLGAGRVSMGHKDHSSRTG